MGNRSSRYVFSILIVCGVWGTSQGSLISHIGSVTLAPGDTGTVDVLVRSDGTDFVQSFGIRLQLDAPNNLLRFTNPPANAELSEANYLFSGNSDASLHGSTATVGTTSTTDDTYDGADMTATFGDIKLTTDDRLLVRLEVTAAAGATPGAYELRLSESTSTFFDMAANSLPFTAASGTVVVVPEPASGLTWGLGLGLTAVGRFRRRESAR